jgi:hypothetical protein
LYFAQNRPKKIIMLVVLLLLVATVALAQDTTQAPATTVDAAIPER